MAILAVCDNQFHFCVALWADDVPFSPSSLIALASLGGVSKVYYGCIKE